MRLSISTLTISLLVILMSQVAADGILISWYVDGIPGMTEEKFEAAKSLSTDDICSQNINASSWLETYLLAVGAGVHAQDREFLRRLAEQVPDTSQRYLTGTKRLVIWERIALGDILFEGKGARVDDDLFCVGGRANWILRNITARDFGHITPSSTVEERLNIQSKWMAWLEGGEPEQYQNPYHSDSGIADISSMAALEALIVSLKPSEAKDQVTMNCLKTLYGLDEMPEDENAQERLCCPDTYSLAYLKMLTEVEDAHDYQWWLEWWGTSRNRLVWDKTRAKFVLGTQ